MPLSMPLPSKYSRYRLASALTLCLVWLMTTSSGFIIINGSHQRQSTNCRQTTHLDLSQTNDDLEEEENDKKSPRLLRLAELSLKDYKWRSSIFKSEEADRKVEESLARMMGDEPAYVRPMDASEGKIGPLGLLEKSSVDWLRNVIEEEGVRAKEIVRLGGMMVRPIEAEAVDGELGPLGFMEKQFVDFLDTIRQSEQERSLNKISRPKDLDEAKRGPLGDAELKAVESIQEVLEGERVRIQQSKVRERVVRPIDVPGPIGEFEMKVLEVIKAEKQRASDRRGNMGFVRPMNASMKGPLGELEEQAVAVVDRLTLEEKERLRNIQKLLDENRPMELDKYSLLGILETVAVGIFRAPILFFQLISRVKELLESEELAAEDAEILEERADYELRRQQKDEQDR